MSLNCIRCQNKIENLVTLICDHQLCLKCAHAIKKEEGSTALDLKIRIVCPMCQKSTLAQCLENLVNTSNDQFLFENMESSELNESSLGQEVFNDPQIKFSQKQLKEMTYSQRFSKTLVDRKTPDIHECRSKGSNDSKRNGRKSAKNSQCQLNTQCYLHKENLMFYCDQQKRVMCMQCIYKHTKQHKNHKVFQIKQALAKGSIQLENKSFKQDAKRRMEQIDKYLAVSQTRRQEIEKSYSSIEVEWEKNFKELELLIKNKKGEIMEILSQNLVQQIGSFEREISDYKYLKECLKEHYDYNIDSENSQLYFFNAYSIMKDSIEKGLIKLRESHKTDQKNLEQINTTFNPKNISLIKDFKNLIDSKFMKIFSSTLTNKRSTAQSRDKKNGSQGRAGSLEQSKQILEDYKNAKKTLEKINKIEKEFQTGKDKKQNKNYNYLNNYVIQVQRKSEKTVGGLTARERKSSIGVYLQNNDQRKSIQISKPLTPTRLISSKNKKNNK